MFGWVKTARPYARWSVFQRTFVTAFGALLVVAVIFLLLMYQMAFENMRRSIQESNVHILQKTVALMDTNLEMLLGSVDELVENATIVNTALVPDESGGQRNFQSVMILKNFQDGNDYIASAALLTTRDDLVYTPYDDVKPLEQFYGEQLFSAPADAALGDGQTGLIIRDDAVYLRRDFLPGYEGVLGSLLIRLDLQKLYDELCGQMPGLLIAVGDTLLPLKTEGETPDLPDGAFTAIGDGVERCTEGTVVWLTMDSSASGLRYYYPYRETALGAAVLPGQVTTVGLLARVLPLLLLIALLIAWLYYRPIKTLLQTSHLPAEPEEQGNRNEWALLSRAIGTMNDQNQHFKDLVAMAAPDIQRRLLADLIDGRPITEEELRLTLGGIASPLDPEGRFALFVAADRITGVMDDHVLQGCLERLGELRVGNLAAMPFAYLHSAAVLFQLGRAGETDQSVSLEELGRVVRLHGDLPPEAGLGCAGVFTGLRGLAKAYPTAYAQAIRGKGEETADDELKQAVQETLAALPEQPPEVGALMLRRLCERLFAPECSDEKRLDRARLLCEGLSRLADSLGLSARSWEAFANSPDPAAEVQACAQELFVDMSEILERRRNRYLIEAIHYLEEHYADCDLSLRSTAEQVGINPSYLSKLFNSAYGKGFGQYLNELRIRQAKRLLADERLRILDVSQQTGFLSVQNFMRVFKKQTGCTPGEYRQISRKTDPE